jgi:pimeloyl-ACP methyl ester carboxylesterase
LESRASTRLFYLKGAQAMVSSEGYVTMEDGVRVFAEKVGSGAKAVELLNGLYLCDDFKYLADGRTLISLDLRNRGRSDFVTDRSKLTRGVLQDVDDLDVVRRHFGIDRIDVIAHSYAAKTAILYAMKYPDHVNRIVQLGPVQPNQATQYAPPLSNADATLLQFFAAAAELQKERASTDPTVFCRKFWALLRPIYVVNPNDADRITWERCDLLTELSMMKYWLEDIMPSIQRATPTAEELAQVTAPTLIVHGSKDRSAPYGGGREWALMLPNARLVTVDDAAHAPWIEAPERVFGSIETFLDGGWPEGAEKVQSLASAS